MQQHSIDHRDSPFFSASRLYRLLVSFERLSFRITWYHRGGGVGDPPSAPSGEAIAGPRTTLPGSWCYIQMD
jgi:hypothetical protein